ncbi:MAG: hypothetical protein EWV75_04335 [Microcystis wesenbergii Mw_QC_S_20081001_S30D]|uniref:Uncharacterized protein n=1 Tax=Microcystis wesenbergii Mw_QC_S_20081001_S30D TaxID=2486245 RepID=A0A552JVQ3_9CHRO|nr:MAG: hypothetical protein EWV74_16040 [Microcystis wesenbergii Mw_QC_S_20081001_S30]TRU99833.1 MAG: hypothetical protein EWV75_04335 [Microcystis wesenbergii Mw_QC_S_20081001_S30D]TRV04781.1 MAG: hypothetical protein EWV73_02105 [Microcystis wesenbergii Mw_QC_B_20070930_S4D]TRV10344.1 MAG: hypothetical protein EWV89_17220 [Microcystis wesenbergii Mw_QC_B_20070930_S4]
MPLSLFLLNPIFESIFFSLILAQKPYIYGRTDSHYIKSLKQVSPFVKGFEKKNRADFIITVTTIQIVGIIP